MNFQTAQTEVLTLLKDLVNLAEAEYEGVDRNPCDALHGLQREITEIKVPIFFRNRVAEILLNLIGMQRRMEMFPNTLKSLNACISYFAAVEPALSIDVADQIRRSGFVPSLAKFSSLELDDVIWEAHKVGDTTAGTAKAVVGDLTVDLFLDQSKFASVRRCSPREWTTYTTWEERCRKLINQMPVNADAVVIGWIAGEIIATQWSEVLRNADQLLGDFYDHYVFSPDFAWVLFFFHHNSMEYGIRTVDGHRMSHQT